MEAHAIVDFGYDPVDDLLWAQLERAPRPAWVHNIEGWSDSRSGLPLPVLVEGERLYLNAPEFDELDRLTILKALVDAANELSIRPYLAGR